MIDIEIHIRQKQHEGYPVEIRLGNQQHFMGIIPKTITDAVIANTPLETGNVLFHALFNDSEPQHAWYRTLSHPQKRVRLWIDREVHDLNRLSWECLYDGESFLSANAGTPFSRYCATQHPWGETLALQPIKMVVAVSAPQAGLSAELPLIYPDAEYEVFDALKKVLPTGLLDITFLEPPISLCGIENKLQEDQGFQVLHIIAHGIENIFTKQSQIILQDQDGFAKPLAVQDFAKMIGRQINKPQLVFLASCWSSHHAISPLMDAGIPTVIAMQKAIGMEVIRQMTYEFYVNLLGEDHYGIVDLALNQARRLILSAEESKADIPVIYMRHHEGQLFSKTKPVNVSDDGKQESMQKRLQQLPRFNLDGLSEPREAKTTFLTQLSHMLTFRETGTPVQFLRPVKYLMGRQDIVHEVISALMNGKTLALYGCEGVGKSAIASEAAWVLAPDGKPADLFSDGIITYSFFHQPEISLAADYIIRKFIRYSNDNSLETLRRILSNKRALIILEDTECADNLAELLDSMGQTAVLITSQKRPTSVSQCIEVNPLSCDETTTLLMTAIGSGVQKRIPRHVLTNLITHLDGLPLTIDLAGRYLKHSGDTISRYLDGLHATSEDGEIQGILRKTVSQLTELEQSILSVCGILALSPIDPVMLTDILQVDRAQLQHALTQLVNYGLLRSESHLYQLRHAAIQTYALQNLPVTGESFHSLTKYYTNIFDSDIQSNINRFEQLEEKFPHILKHIDTLSGQSSWMDVIHLIQIIDTFVDVLGHWVIWERVLGKTLHRLLQNRQIASPIIQDLLVRWNKVNQQIGYNQKVLEYLERILRKHKELEDQWGVAHINLYLGVLHMENQDWVGAIRYNRQALNDMRKLEDTNGMAHAYSNMFKMHQQRSAWKQAQKSYRKYLQIDGKFVDKRNPAENKPTS